MKIAEIRALRDSYWDPVNLYSIVNHDYYELIKECIYTDAYNGKSHSIIKESALPEYVFETVESLTELTDKQRELSAKRRSYFLKKFAMDGYEIQIDEEYRQIKVTW
ncbi:hypothetical protein AC4_226 [Acinetobacter phage AC4]|nr:hypothetical protein AC4_226 [Acinetobacter phage AC4]